MNTKRVISVLGLLVVLSLAVSGLGAAVPSSASASSGTAQRGGCITLICPKGYVQDTVTCTCKRASPTGPAAFSFGSVSAVRACIDLVCPRGYVQDAANCKCKPAPTGTTAAAFSFGSISAVRACIDLMCPGGYVRDARTCKCAPDSTL